LRTDKRSLWMGLVRITAIFLIVITTIVGHLPTAEAVLFVSVIPAGGFLWKIPPFEIGPRPGLRNGFIEATADRGRAAVVTTATWAGRSGVTRGSTTRLSGSGRRPTAMRWPSAAGSPAG
jgi:hypothetical protein